MPKPMLPCLEIPSMLSKAGVLKLNNSENHLADHIQNIPSLLNDDTS